LGRGISVGSTGAAPDEADEILNPGCRHTINAVTAKGYFSNAGSLIDNSSDLVAGAYCLRWQNKEEPLSSAGKDDFPAPENIYAERIAQAILVLMGLKGIHFCYLVFMVNHHSW
jgi:hypothetical protein